MITMPPFFTGEGPLLVLARGREAWNCRVVQPEMHVPGMLRLRKAILATWRGIHDDRRAETFFLSVALQIDSQGGSQESRRMVAQ